MASTDLETLVVRLEADTRQLRKELTAAERSADTAARGISSRMQAAGAGFARATKEVLSFRTAVAGVAGAAVLGGLIRNATSTANALADTADKLGLNIERLQEYRAAAETVGVAQQTTDLALQRFTRRLGEAQQGTGELKGVLEQYNVAVRNADGTTRSAESVLRDLADVTRGAKDEQERLRIAFKAFDSEGAALVNLLKQGSGELDELRDRMRAAGTVMDEDLVRQAAAFNTELTTLERGIKTSFQAGLLEGFSSQFNDLKGSMTDPQFLAAVEDVGELLGMFATSAPKGVGSFRTSVRDLVASLHAANDPLNAAIASSLAVAGGPGAALQFLNQVRDPSLLDENFQGDASDQISGGGGGGGGGGGNKPPPPPKPVRDQLAERRRFMDSLERETELQKARAEAVLRGEEALREVEQAYEVMTKLQELGIDRTSEEADVVRKLWLQRDMAKEAVERETEAIRDRQRAAEQNAREEEREAERKAEAARRADEKAEAERKRQIERHEELMRAPMENAIKGVQGAFTDAFENILSGGTLTFESLAEQAKRIFIRMASELASLHIIRPVLAGLFPAMAAGGASAQGILPGEHGGIGLGGFGDVGGMLNDLGAQFGVGNLSSYLGVGALGAAGGGVLADLTGGNSTYGSVGGGLGAMAGFALGGPLGALIGGGAGGLLGGLFGPGKPNPGGQATVDISGGSLRVGGVGAKHLDPAAIRAMGGNATVALQSLIGASGGYLDPGITGTVGAVAQRGGRYISVAAGGERAFGSEAEAVADFVARVLTSGNVVRGLTDNVQRAITGSSGGSLEVLTANIELARSIDLITGASSEATRQLQELNQKFADMRMRAQELGLSVEAVNRAQVAALRDLEASVQGQLASNLGRADSVLNLTGLRALRDQVSFGQLSGASPLTAIAGQRAAFDQVAQAALAGDVSAIQSFPGIAQQLLTSGRDVFASGPGFADLLGSVRGTLDQLLGQNEALQASLGVDIDIALRETAQDQIAAIRDQTGRLSEDLRLIRRELQGLRA